MEKRVFKIAFLLISFCTMFGAMAQLPSQKDQLRIQIWADLDPFPGKFEDDTAQEEYSFTEEHEIDDLENDAAASENQEVQSSDPSDTPEWLKEVFGFAIDRAKEVTPFILSGMLYGWTFEYTPSDKSRKVSEYFEFNEVHSFDYEVNKIEYHAPVVKDGKLLVWAYCDRNGAQKLSYERWSSIVHPHVQGTGTGSVEDGFEGIRAACGEAVKNAVREHWRIYEKNKPKEITGSVLLINNPRIYIKDGKYVVVLDFFMETDKITRYNYY